MKYDIIIVGGGSAGWMTASSLIKEFPDKKIALIESPEIANIGVGESTIGQLRFWTKFLGIEDKSFLKHTDGTYKLSIKLDSFYKKGESFHYPFGEAFLPWRESIGRESDLTNGFNDWWCKKMIYPETPVTDYIECYYPHAHMIDQNKLSYNSEGQFGNFDFFVDSAFHFDAVKFGLRLRDYFSLPRGVVHIKEHITDVKQNEDGSIESLNEKYEADLFVDCTGFVSLLLGKTLKVPFESYLDILPNNSAWATRLQYKNKREELVNYTHSTAVENGWIWKIPLWSKMGTGYVYSDNFIDDDAALKQFQKHLGTDELEFRNIKMKVGLHERLWEKNVVAIGLSAGFIEPLEGNGLFSVHEFIRELIRELKRDKISQWDRDDFTFRCKQTFRAFAEFVSLHYVLSHRDDTEYWRHIRDESWLKDKNRYFIRLAEARTVTHDFNNIGGIHLIATGMHYSPTELTEEMWSSTLTRDQLVEGWAPRIDNLNQRKRRWSQAAKESENTYDFLKRNIYD